MVRDLLDLREYECRMHIVPSRRSRCSPPAATVPPGSQREDAARCATIPGRSVQGCRRHHQWEFRLPTQPSSQSGGGRRGGRRFGRRTRSSRPSSPRRGTDRRPIIGKCTVAVPAYPFAPSHVGQSRTHDTSAQVSAPPRATATPVGLDRNEPLGDHNGSCVCLGHEEPSGCGRRRAAEAAALAALCI